MHLYRKYLAERDSANLHFTEYGFVTYSIAPNHYMYFSEFFVVEEKRNTREAWKLWQFVLETAKVNNCNFITGSVDISTNNWELSEKLMKKVGFVQCRTFGDMKYFVKNL